MFRLLLGAAAAVLGAGSALAQTPGLQSGSGFSDQPAVFTIINDTPYSLFTETLGAGQHCIDRPIPATSIPAGGRQQFPMSGNIAGSCSHDPSVGQQTFVIGSPGPEQRINAPFQISTHADGNRVADGLRTGPFLLSGAVSFTTEKRKPPIPVEPPVDVMVVQAQWRVSCAGPC